MNTEKMIVRAKPDEMGVYCNTNLDFVGTIAEAKVYAQKHGFGGGVEVAAKINGKTTFTQV